MCKLGNALVTLPPIIHCLTPSFLNVSLATVPTIIKRFTVPTISMGWVMRQDWVDLSMLHWRLSDDAATKLSSILPDGVDLDYFEGEAWVTIVPFRMSKIRPRFLPWLPFLSNFPELNLRTYVSVNGKPGVWFLSLDTPSRSAVYIGCNWYSLPYYRSSQSMNFNLNSQDFKSIRTNSKLEVKVQRESEYTTAEASSLEAFLFERYCLVSSHRNRIHVVDVKHAPWEFATASCTISENTITTKLACGLELDLDPTNPDHCHISPGVVTKIFRSQ